MVSRNVCSLSTAGLLVIGCGSGSSGGKDDTGTVSECEPPAGPGVEHTGTLAGDETWAADENAAVSIYGEPGGQFITDSLFADSGRIGVNLAYHGSFVDFASTNTFFEVPGCDVSWPRQEDGSCPEKSPCD